MTYAKWDRVKIATDGEPTTVVTIVKVLGNGAAYEALTARGKKITITADQIQGLA